MAGKLCEKDSKNNKSGTSESPSRWTTCPRGPEKSSQGLLPFLQHFQLHGPPASGLTSSPNALSVDEATRSYYQDFHVHNSSNVFSRRITALAWHPNTTSNPTTLTAGLKKGEILIWNYLHSRNDIHFLKSRHICLVQDMQYSPLDDKKLFTVGGDGLAAMHDLDSIQENNYTIFASKDDWKHWWCSLDTARDKNLLAIGDTSGRLYAYDMRTLSEKKVLFHRELHHHKKLTGLQFNPSDSNLLVTTSNDHTARIWDVRMLQKKMQNKDLECLAVLPHDSVVNSAYFSPMTRTRLLTTAQDDELRIYDLNRVATGDKKDEVPVMKIPHPHHFYRYLTYFKAKWHPWRENLFLCGRYYYNPEDEEFRKKDVRRYVDVLHCNLNAKEGEEQVQTISLFENGIKTISPLNEWSPSGEAIVSGSAGVLYIWRSGSLSEGKKRKLEQADKKHPDDVPTPRRYRKQPKKKKKTKGKGRVKKLVLSECEKKKNKKRKK